ncbi:Hpt domain-containing protein [Pseudotabrizicola sp.]|uniref:Hpt domain-containing protein n=1 Tax=Pseudotabrizicola sp. TaxID=2939647 RepID=UPI002721281C|nr:Hpt domain-containing protein [Pseudotabrizicola sp.]MDO8884133.1 Hpt domain-containing protein [Pseudotabrizicola sp.]
MISNGGNLEAGHDPLSAAEEIGKIAHKISGTAATFGFGTLGKQAQAVEAICGNIRGLSGPAVAEMVQDRLLPALDLLTQEFDVVLVAAT